MAITVSGKNYTQISSCDTLTSGGTWTGVDTPDSIDKKEGTASLCGTLKAAGDNNTNFVPSSAVNLLNKHLRFWFLITSGGLVNTYALGGIQFWCSDGTNTGYWYVGGRDTYPGGWCNYVVDLSKAVDAGTKPTAMNLITSMGTRHNLTIAGKNVDNVWIDSFSTSDGLITYGDDAGGYYDFDDIFAVENDPSTGGFGILTRKAGVYCLVGSVEFGDALGTAGTKFNAKSQTIVFENRANKDGTLSNINSSLLGFNIVDNGTGTTEFILGEKSGTQGISGCTVRTQNTAQLAKFYIDAATDTDVDNFKLYGSNFLDAGTISLPANAVTAEALNCNFEACGQVVADTCMVKYCNFISCKSTVDAAVLVNDDPHYVTDSNFISCPNAVEIDTVGDAEYDFNNLKFSGNTYDVNNTSGSSLTVVKANGSDPSSYTGTTVSFISSITLTLTVKDQAGDPVVGASAYIDDDDLGTPILLTTTNAQGIATTPYSGSDMPNSRWRVRKYGYFPFEQYIATTGVDINLPVTLIIDTLQP